MSELFEIMLKLFVVWFGNYYGLVKNFWKEKAMKLDSEMLERLIAIGVVVAGCLLEQSILICIGIIYFIAKM